MFYFHIDTKIVFAKANFHINSIANYFKDFVYAQRLNHLRHAFKLGKCIQYLISSLNHPLVHLPRWLYIVKHEFSIQDLHVRQCYRYQSGHIQSIILQITELLRMNQ